jgi:hypothetical protein
MVKFFILLTTLLKKCLTGRALLWVWIYTYIQGAVVGRDISFLRDTQHCMATGSPLQEDASDIKKHVARI